MNYFWSAISSHGNRFDLLVFLASAALKVTLLLGFVALLCLVLRRLSAATRHLLWTLSLCAALLLPFLSVLEIWEVPLLPAQFSSSSPTQSDQLTKVEDDASFYPEEAMGKSVKVSSAAATSSAGNSDFQPITQQVESAPVVTNTSNIESLPQQSAGTFLSTLVNWALAIWFAGAVLLLCKLLVGFLATHLLTRGTVEFADPKMKELFSSLSAELHLKSKVRLLRSERTLMPIVCGVLRPVVLLPASADDWSEERRRMVLLHELTHVTRRDCLTQMLAQTACAIYWFNPVVWHAARRLRVEREQACDDYVLSIGTKPSDYAHHLLEIARYLQEHSVFQWSQTTTVAMARRSQLEGRLLAILSQENQRRAMSQVMNAGMAALVLLLFVSLAVVRPTTSRAQKLEQAFTNEPSVAEKSPAGLFQKKASGTKDNAIALGVEPQALSETPEHHAQSADQQKNSDSPQTIADVKPESESDAVDAVAESTPLQPPSFPTPPGIVQDSQPAVPFIKAQYQEERKSEAQGKSADFIDEMAAVGYTNLSIKELVSLKVSGVTADYVRGLNALGFGHLTTKELAGMRINDVTPAFIQTIRNAGYKDLTTRDLVSFSVHGVTPEFINGLKNAGYANLPARQLIEFAVHAVTPEFINSVRALGFGNLSPKDLVTLRVHNITPDFVRAARKRLGDLTLKQIVALKIGGILEDSEKK